MKIVCISDTHELHRRLPPLPEGDVLIHAGDLTGNGKLPALYDAARWLRSQPHKYKIVIAGNHDLTLESDPEIAREIFHDLIYLNKTAHMMEGLKVYGTPWSPAFCDWAFNATPRQQELHAAAIPANTDILISHGPPYRIRDKTNDGLNVGCKFLARRIREIKPKLVVCGHIHHSHGVSKLKCGTTVVNAAVLDDDYRLVHAPIVVDLPV